ASLFGGEPEYQHDSAVYDRSLTNGSTVVTVKAAEQYLTQVMDILERHNPVDIDERAATYGVSQTTTACATGAPLATGTDAGRSTDETIELAQESVVLGTRAINRG